MSDVRGPSVSGTIGGQNLEIGSIEWTRTINQPSTIVVNGHEAPKSIVTQFDIGQAAAAAATYQQRLFQERSAPDTRLEVHDGINTATFTGLMTTPALTIDRGDVGRPISAVSELALLRAFNTSIYEPLHDYERDNETLETLKTPGFTEKVSKIHDGLVKQWTKNIEQLALFSPLTAARARSRHAVNQRLLDRFKALLSASAETAAWSEIDTLADSQREAVGMDIQTILLQGGADGLQMIDALCQSYALALVERVDGTAYLTRLSDMFTRTPESLTIPNTGIRFAPGGGSGLPVTHVSIQAAYQQRYRDRLAPGQAEGQGNEVIGAVYAYPDTPLVGGADLDIPGPPWLRPVSMAFPDNLSESVDVLSLDAYEEQAKSVMNYVAKLEGEVETKILKQWAYIGYLQATLGMSMTSCRIPLDLTLVPGAIYAVQDIGGAAIFTGLLNSVTHNLVTQGSRLATTSLEFTHCEMNGFTLPGRTLS